MSECPSCARHHAKKESQSHSSGIYALGCVDCCARLLMTAPSKSHQEQMISVIKAIRNTPSREQILAAVKDARNES